MYKFRVLTYNVLADAFAKPEYFPHTKPEELAVENRYPAILRRLIASEADIICLQEVDAALWQLLCDSLYPLGYEAAWARRSESKPDGCATFWRANMFDAVSKAIRYDEIAGQKPAQRMVLIGDFILNRVENSFRFVVANTHLAWEPLDCPSATNAGLAEAYQLMNRLTDGVLPLVVCGDFNAEPDSSVLRVFRHAGLVDSHDSGLPTNVANGRIAKIDYLMATLDLRAQPLRTAAQLNDSTPLPSATEPSDHLPLITDFTC